MTVKTKSYGPGFEVDLTSDASAMRVPGVSPVIPNYGFIPPIEVPHLARNGLSKIRSYCRVVIHQFNVVGKGPGFPGFSTSLKLEIKEEVLTCSVTNHVSQPCPSFSFVLPANKEWMKLIHPDDFVEIYMSSGGPEEMVCLGTVERIQYAVNMDASTFAAKTTVHVSGSGFGKILQNTEFVVDVNASPDEWDKRFTADWTHRMSAISNVILYPATAGQIVLAGLRAMFSSIPSVSGEPTLMDQWKFPPSGSSIETAQTFGKFITAAIQSPFLIDPATGRTVRDKKGNEVQRTVGYTPQIYESIPQFTNLWQMITEFADPVFNDLYTEIYRNPNAASGDPEWKKWLYMIVHREHPYSLRAMQSIPAYRISAVDDVFEPSLGYSSNLRKNYFRVTPTPDLFDGSTLMPISSGGAYSYANKSSIIGYGLRKYEVQTRFPFSSPEIVFSAKDSDIKNDAAVLCAALTSKITRWYCREHEMLNGTLRCRLLTGVRLGYRLDMINDVAYVGKSVDRTPGYAFNIEGYTKTYSYPEGSSTEIVVSRGVPLDDLTSVSGEYKDDTPKDLGFSLLYPGDRDAAPPQRQDDDIPIPKDFA